MELKEKMRIVQELVPGKQVTLCHIIANPDDVPSNSQTYTSLAVVISPPFSYTISNGNSACVIAGVGTLWQEQSPVRIKSRSSTEKIFFMRVPPCFPSVLFSEYRSG